MTDYTPILLAFLFGCIFALVLGRLTVKIMSKAESVPLWIRVVLAFIILESAAVLVVLLVDDPGTALVLPFAIGFHLVLTLMVYRS